MAVHDACLLPDDQAPAEGKEDRLGVLFCELFEGRAGPVNEPFDLARTLAGCDGPESVEQVLASAPLSSRQQGALNVGLWVLREFFGQPVFHPELARVFLDSSGAMLVSLVRDKGWLSGRAHPFYRWLEEIAALAVGWYPDHVQAEEMRTQMTHWLERLARGDSLADVLHATRQWCQRFYARTSKLEQRLCQREKGAMRLEFANREAARVINRQLAGRQLPAELAHDLPRVWLPALQWILLNESGDSGLWNRAVRLLTLLFWSVQPPAEEQRAREKRRRVTADLARDLPVLLERVLPEPGLSERMLESLQIIWMSVEHGRALEYVRVSPLDTGSLLDQAGASVSGDLLREINGVSERDWFEEQAGGRRFRLLMKQEQYQQLMFVDQAGCKAGNESCEDFAWQLTNGSVMPVGLPAPPAELVAERLNRLAGRFRDKRRMVRPAKTGVANPQRNPVALESVRARSEEARQRQQEALREAPGHDVGENPGRRKWARLLVSSLTLGTWVRLQRDAVSLDRKLILILSSTDKYVLVAADGTGRLELSRADLTRGVVDGSITLAAEDSRFDDTLDRVVGDLQRQRTRR